MFYLPKSKTPAKKCICTIAQATIGRAALILPVSYSRNSEDGFMYEDARPQNNVVMAILPDGTRWMKDGEQDLLDSVKAAGEIDIMDGWTRHPYSVYGSSAWQEEMNREQW